MSSLASPAADRSRMTLDEQLRLVAGVAVLASLALGTFVHPAFLLFTAFVGLNLLQSAFTKWCPVMWILKRLGGGAAPAGGCCGKT